MVRIGSKRTWGIILAILVVLTLAAISTFILGRRWLRKAFWMEPYDESHPASILTTIRDNSVVRFPENVESFKAADRTDRGIDFPFYIFILRFKTDRDGLAQLRESLSQLFEYSEWKVDLDKSPDELMTFHLKGKPGQIRTPEWYRELPEGEVWTAGGVGERYTSDGLQRNGKFFNIDCTWVVLGESEEVVVYMEGVGYYSLKDYSD